MATTVKPSWAFGHLADGVANGFEERSVSFGNVEVTVNVETDSDSLPTDADCYTADDVAKFGAYWRYVTVTVSIDVAGATASASLAGVEHGIVSAEIESVYLAQDVLPTLYREARDLISDAHTALSSLTLA